LLTLKYWILCEKDVKLIVKKGAIVIGVKNNVKCPNCGSYKTFMLGKGAAFIFGLFLASMTAIVGIIFPPLWLGTLAGFVIMMAAPFKKNGEVMCNGCNFKWKLEPEEKEGVGIRNVIPAFLETIKKRI
jgi:uncharacterized Zn-finger protein